MDMSEPDHCALDLKIMALMREVNDLKSRVWILERERAFEVSEKSALVNHPPIILANQQKEVSNEPRC